MVFDKKRVADWVDWGAKALLVALFGLVWDQSRTLATMGRDVGRALEGSAKFDAFLVQGPRPTFYDLSQSEARQRDWTLANTAGLTWSRDQVSELKALILALDAQGDDLSARVLMLERLTQGTGK